MQKFAGIFILLIGLCFGLSAQQPAYHEDLAKYKEATELYDKAKYAAAAEKFGSFIESSTKSTSFKHANNDLVAEARFYQAVCAFNLLNSNTIPLFKAYLRDYPSHNRNNEAYFYIGKMHYMRKAYVEAILPLENVESGNLTKQQVVEARFMLGYGYYKQGRTKDALAKFRQIKNAEGPWAEMGSYFYAVLAYEEGNYAEAYDAFGRVKEDAKYAKDVQELKASCLLKLQRYEELDQLGEGFLQNPAGVSSQVYFILGNAAYDRAKYGDCIKYFDQYLSKRGTLNRMGHYRMGYSQYRQGDFGLAQSYFEKVTLEDDALAQNAFYYLGHCFLKLNKQENARTAFKKAASGIENKEISEESLYQYAKLSFETHYFEDALSALQNFLKTYPSSPYTDEGKSLIGEILLFSSNYKEAIDYLEENDGLRNNRSRTAYQRACYFYAVSMFEKRMYDVAADYFKKAYNQNQDTKITILAYYWHAESLFRQKAFGESLPAYRAFLNQPYAAKHDLYPMAWYGLGWSTLSMNKYEEAGQHFEKFIGLADREKNRDEYVDALLRAGDCEFALKSYTGALRYYQQVRDFKGPFADYAIFQIGSVQIRKQEYQKAAETLSKLALTYQKSVYREDALIMAATTYLSWLDDWANAAKYAQILIKDHPESKYVPTAVSLMAISEGKSGNTQKAIYWFKLAATEHCYDESARTGALTNLADLLDASEYDQVERQSREKCPIVRTGENDEKAEELAINIADQRFFDENYVSAAERYAAYAKDFPMGKYLFQAKYYHGQCLEKIGKSQEALADYEFIYEKSKVNDFSVKALKSAADIQFASGNTMAAMELYAAMNDKSTRIEDRLAAQFGKAEVELTNENYEAAKTILMGIYTDPNTTDYSRTKANVKIAVCQYFLGDRASALSIFKSITQDYTIAFGAESQYYTTRILFDDREYELSKTEALIFNEKFLGYNYWKAKAFLVLAEDYLALQDTFQATTGTLESIIKNLTEEKVYPEIRDAAQKRLDEIRAIQGANNRMGKLPEEDEDNGGGIDDMIKEEKQ